MSRRRARRDDRRLRTARQRASKASLIAGMDDGQRPVASDLSPLAGKLGQADGRIDLVARRRAGRRRARSPRCRARACRWPRRCPALAAMTGADDRRRGQDGGRRFSSEIGWARRGPRPCAGSARPRRRSSSVCSSVAVAFGRRCADPPAPAARRRAPASRHAGARSRLAPVR